MEKIVSSAAFEPLDVALARLEAGTPPPPGAGLFGVSLDPAACALVLIPVPWDTTVSYGDGTAQGPQAILAASHQLDLEDAAFGQPYRQGISMLPVDASLSALNQAMRPLAMRVISRGGADSSDPDLLSVNAASREVNTTVERLAGAHLDSGRIVGVIGGDHSSPFGLIKALADARPGRGFGLLHFDAHHDFRDAYEGFTFSHASIMHNVMERIPGVTKLVQVGIRDYSRDERAYAEALGARADVFYSRDLFRRKASGETWATTTKAIIATLPAEVYVSFDIDGLDAAFCPHTGTPVPGGLTYDEALFVIEELVASGRRIIGFDLCEVTPGGDGDEWDANVGARVLYKLCGGALMNKQA